MGTIRPGSRGTEQRVAGDPWLLWHEEFSHGGEASASAGADLVLSSFGDFNISLRSS